MTIQARIIALLISLLVLTGMAFAIYSHGVSQGHRLERADWLAKENNRIAAEQKATLKAIENNTRIAQQQEIDKRKVINDHQTEIAAIRAAYEHPAGRLRITRAVCDSVAATAKADSASGIDAATAGTVALPEPIERDLRKLANDADEVTAKARALQASVKTSGCFAE